jgi:hypothetical protein
MADHDGSEAAVRASVHLHEAPVVAAPDAPKQSASGLEELDRMLRVTPSTAWPILITLIAAVAVALVWSVVSHSPQRSEGNGILLTPLGVADIPAEGNVEELKVRPGQKVKAGELVASWARTILRPGSGKSSPRARDAGDWKIVPSIW